MMIKKIRICGFKGFNGDHVICVPFGRSFSIFVGAANAGKTNFIRAIEFALDFMSNEDHLQPLTHESDINGISPMAFVEIVFDNSMNTIPIDKQEIVLRRTFVNGAFHSDLDGQRIVGTELKKKLQLMGFEKSYPFYFSIKQNDIVELMNANERILLTTLMQIAGVDDYQNAKRKCHRMLEDADVELEAVTNILTKIDIHLNALELVNNGSKYQGLLDKQRYLNILIERCQWIRLTETKESMTIEKERHIAQIEADSTQLTTMGNEMKYKRARNRSLEALIHESEHDQKQIESDQALCIANLFRLNKKMYEMENEIESDANNKHLKEKEKQFVRTMIHNKQTEADTLETELNKSMAEAQNVSVELDERRREFEAIFESFSKTRSLPLIFYSAEERDAWIKQQGSITAEQIAKAAREIERLSTELNRRAAQSADTDETALEAGRKTIANKQEQERNENKHLLELRRKIAEMEEEKKHIGAQEIVLMESLARKKGVLEDARQKFLFKIGPGIYNGIKSVRRIVMAHCPELSAHYHGLAIEQFTCDQELHKLIDVVAKNKLFLHVVDSDVTVIKILKEMNRLNMPGSPMFVPINRIVVEDSEHHTNERCFINKLTFDSKFSCVMEYIFGKVQIYCDLEHVAAQGRNKPGFKCVTLSGDIVLPGGAISGGFIPSNSSRITAYHDWRQARLAVDELEKTRKANRRRQTELNDSIALNSLNIREVGAKLTDIRMEIQQGRSKLASKKRRMYSMQSRRDNILAELRSYEDQLVSLVAEKNHLESELGQVFLPLDKQIRADELRANIQQLQTKQGEFNRYCIALSKKWEQTAEFLSVQLIPRYNDILKVLESSRLKSDELQKMDNEKKLTSDKLKGIAQRLNAQTHRVKEQYDEFIDNKKAMQNLLSARKRLKAKIEMDKQALRALAEREESLIAEIGNMAIRIASIALPNDIQTEYCNASEEELANVLRGLQHDLNAFNDDANFLAIKQTLDTFNKDRITLGRRRSEMLKETHMIQKLLEAKNEKIYESILSTFGMLQMYFGQVFKRFVRRGFGRLILKKDGSGIDNNINNFQGVEIRASFASTYGEGVTFDQLENEQKSVVAIALAFAIQKCSRSPFYLVDCIERVLSDKYKRIVVCILQQLSKTSQIIATTDYLQLVSVGGAFYRISKDEKNVANIQQIKFANAQAVVEPPLQIE